MGYVSYVVGAFGFSDVVVVVGVWVGCTGCGYFCLVLCGIATWVCSFRVLLLLAVVCYVVYRCTGWLCGLCCTAAVV